MGLLETTSTITEPEDICRTERIKGRIFKVICKYPKKIYVKEKGGSLIASGNGTELIFTLPGGFRPIEIIFY